MSLLLNVCILHPDIAWHNWAFTDMISCRIERPVLQVFSSLSVKLVSEVQCVWLCEQEGRDNGSKLCTEDFSGILSPAVAIKLKFSHAVRT
jgi:hypothetical protein